MDVDDKRQIHSFHIRNYSRLDPQEVSCDTQLNSLTDHASNNECIPTLGLVVLADGHHSAAAIAGSRHNYESAAVYIRTPLELYNAIDCNGRKFTQHIKHFRIIASLCGGALCFN